MINFHQNCKFPPNVCLSFSEKCRAHTCKILGVNRYIWKFTEENIVFTQCTQSQISLFTKNYQNLHFAKSWNFDQNCKFRPNFDQNWKFRPNFVKIWWKLGRQHPKKSEKFRAHTEIYGGKHYFYTICTIVWSKNFTKFYKNSKFCKIWKFLSVTNFRPNFRG